MCLLGAGCGRTALGLWFICKYRWSRDELGWDGSRDTQERVSLAFGAGEKPRTWISCQKRCSGLRDLTKDLQEAHGGGKAGNRVQGCKGLRAVATK